MNLARQYLGLWIGSGLFIACMIFFLAMALAGWPGKPDNCVGTEDGKLVDTCYCETLHDGLIKQPANTWSNLAFVIVGLALLGVVGKFNQSSGATNAMLGHGWIPILFGCIIILMGPGSMYFHASMVDWAGFLDSISMFLLLFFMIGYNILQFTRGKHFIWLSWLIALSAVTGGLLLVISFSEAAAYIFMGFAIATGLFDLFLHIFGSMKRSWVWYGIFLGVFGLAIFIWVASGSDGFMCSRDAVFLQGHVWWHTLSAVAMIFLFLYLRDEQGGRPD